MRPLFHIYNGTYPSSKWVTLTIGMLDQKNAEALVGPADGWLNKAFKIIPGDVSDFLRERRKDVRAVYYHDNTWRVIATSDIDEIANALGEEIVRYQEKAMHLKKDVDDLLSKVKRTSGR